ncbi:MAG: divalent-cation tolerance protein CutA [Campylobacterales bacterium]|nr:divalent-cation tolerance protein CutA [Campylobacterales bacterium]
MKPLLVLSTAPSLEVAKTLAKALLARKLAACVSLQEGVTSLFEWEGALQEETEVMLMIKTKDALFEELKTTLCALHPYEVPEIIALEISKGHHPYVQWIDSLTKDTL